MNSPLATIDDLPPEMLCELFRHLHPRHLGACSAVSKRWHSAYSLYRVDRLVATPDYNYQLHFGYWYHSDQKMEDRELYHPNHFGFLVKKPLLSNLKCLALNGFPPRFNLNKLNRFSMLIQLEVRNYLGIRKLNLRLPRLKILAFSNDRCPLLVDCAELSVLAYFGKGAHLSVQHPETIKRLDTDMVGANLNPFKNVECLITRKLISICKDTLLQLPKLKELRFDRSLCDTYGPFHRPARIDDIDEMKQTCRDFVEDAKKLRPDLKFVFSGFSATKVAEIDPSPKRWGGIDERIYLKNHHLIEPAETLPFVRRLYYEELMADLIERIPSGFGRKLTGVQSVCLESAQAVQEPNQILSFLKSLRVLRRLKLRLPGLSQEFWDALPASTSSLFDFEFRFDLSCFDFIDKWPSLSYLRIDHDRLAFKSLPLVVRHLRRLSAGQFVLHIEGKQLAIWKKSNSKVWKVHFSGRRAFKIEDPDEIVNQLERPRKRRKTIHV